jgi:hypothetical protein
MQIRRKHRTSLFIMTRRHQPRNDTETVLRGLTSLAPVAGAVGTPTVTVAVQVTDPTPVRGHSAPQIVRNPKTGAVVVASETATGLAPMIGFILVGGHGPPRPGRCGLCANSRQPFRTAYVRPTCP